MIRPVLDAAVVAASRECLRSVVGAAAVAEQLGHFVIADNSVDPSKATLGWNSIGYRRKEVEKRYSANYPSQRAAGLLTGCPPCTLPCPCICWAC